MSTTTTTSTTTGTTTGTSDLGEILRPGDPGYEQARQVWNGTVDRYPAMIARCRTAAEVAAAVRLARTSKVEIAVRGGGHSIPGLSVCEGGVMIDLSPMKRVDVDPVEGVARAEPGVLWGEYDLATQEHGLAGPGGEISHTGVAGLTLGGGIGWLSRRHGLACDNLVGAQLVGPDGSVIEVDADSDPELLWGLRGGGGNFGIVTEFRFRVHPVPPLYAGMLMWHADRTQQVLEAYLALAETAPRDLSVVAALLVAPPAPFVPADLQFQPAVAVAAVWTGDATDPDAAGSLAPLRALGPAVDAFDRQPYPVIQQWFDEGVPHGRRYHVRSEWLGELDAPAVEQLVASGAEMTSPFNQVLVRRLGGAIADVGPDDTAFRFRDAAYMLTIASGWDDGADEPHVEWTRRSWDRLHPWSCGGGYVNHLAADEGRDRVREAYGRTTWDRLVALKRRVDPDNVFHLNQNIDPS
jgi:FAD/FMN-containing dehydrogenase